VAGRSGAGRKKHGIRKPYRLPATSYNLGW
jgi:hypothetical protein